MSQKHYKMSFHLLQNVVSLNIMEFCSLAVECQLTMKWWNNCQWLQNFNCLQPYNQPLHLLHGIYSLKQKKGSLYLLQSVYWPNADFLFAKVINIVKGIANNAKRSLASKKFWVKLIFTDTHTLLHLSL